MVGEKKEGEQNKYGETNETVDARWERDFCRSRGLFWLIRTHIGTLTLLSGRHTGFTKLVFDTALICAARLYYLQGCNIQIIYIEWFSPNADSPSPGTTNPPIATTGRNFIR